MNQVYANLKVASRHVTVDRIVAISMIGMGWSLTRYPDRSTAGLITSILNGLFGIQDGAGYYGLVMIICAAAMLGSRRVSQFLWFTSILLFYIVLSGIYWLMTPGTSTVFIWAYAGYYMLLVWIYFDRNRSAIHGPPIFS